MKLLVALLVILAGAAGPIATASAGADTARVHLPAASTAAPQTAGTEAQRLVADQPSPRDQRTSVGARARAVCARLHVEGTRAYRRCVETKRTLFQARIACQELHDRGTRAYRQCVRARVANGQRPAPGAQPQTPSAAWADTPACIDGSNRAQQLRLTIITDVTGFHQDLLDNITFSPQGPHRIAAGSVEPGIIVIEATFRGMRSAAWSSPAIDISHLLQHLHLPAGAVTFGDRCSAR
ncbi:MAG: hypothetical protein ACE367_25240 [Acidimicrobiales bacterium]